MFEDREPKPAGCRILLTDHALRSLTLSEICDAICTACPIYAELASKTFIHQQHGEEKASDTA